MYFVCYLCLSWDLSISRRTPDDGVRVSLSPVSVSVMALASPEGNNFFYHIVFLQFIDTTKEEVAKQKRLQIDIFYRYF